MKNRTLLLSGIAIPVFFTLMIVGLATLVPGYSHVSQTISEIGQAGSPAETSWQLASLVVATLWLLFAWGVYQFSRVHSLPALPAFLIGFFGLMSVGVAVFASPHSLHNLFGLLMTFGYMAPLAMAWSWRRNLQMRPLVRFSWVAWVLVVAAILLNLSPLVTRDLFPLEYYGLVQRSLFIAFHGLWCPVVGLSLYRRTENTSIQTEGPLQARSYHA